jgi:hypothetical protein
MWLEFIAGRAGASFGHINILARASNFGGSLMTDLNFKNNFGFIFDGFITDQQAFPANALHMGLPYSAFPEFVTNHINVFPGFNACGWVSPFNSFHALGMNIPPADIIRWIEQNNAMNISGLFGVNPNSYEALFEYFGVDARTTFASDGIERIDDMARDSNSVILAYVNDGGIWNGAHVVTAVWCDDDGLFTFYNARRGSPQYATINEFLDSVNADSLISLTQVFD